MAGNYDVTNVTVRGNVDNRSSFTTVNGKKQFIGTPWNETSHITNDANKGTIFEADQGMTLKLNSRYKNGGADVYANLDKKHTGISFDLLDKFIEAAADGKLIDVDHAGYTKENMTEFGKAFDELRAQKLAAAKKDPYGKEYTKMMNGTEFTFSADELKTLYKAAGFDLVKEEKKEEVKVEVPPTPEEVEKPKQETKPEPKPEEDEGYEKISQHGKQNVNLIVTELGLPSNACIEFKGDVLREGDKIIYAEGSYKLPDGTTKKFRIDNSGAEKVVQTKKPGLFRKWHNVGEEKAAEAPKTTSRAEAKREREAAPAQQEAPQFRVNKKKAKQVANDKYWGSNSKRGQALELKDAEGNIVASYPAYDQITIRKKNVARVAVKNEDGTTSYKFYEPTAIIIPSTEGEETVVVPDLSKEVKYRR